MSITAANFAQIGNKNVKVTDGNCFSPTLFWKFKNSRFSIIFRESPFLFLLYGNPSNGIYLVVEILANNDIGIYLVVEILANNNNGIYLVVEILANHNNGIYLVVEILPNNNIGINWTP